MPSDRRTLLTKHFGRGGESPQTWKASKLPYRRLASNDPNGNSSRDDQCDKDGFPTTLPPPPAAARASLVPKAYEGHGSKQSTASPNAPVMTSARTKSRQSSMEACPPSPVRRNGAAMFESARPVTGPPPALPPRAGSHSSPTAPPLPPRRPSMTATPTTHLLAKSPDVMPGDYGTMSDDHKARVRSIQQDLDETAAIAHDTIANMLERGEGLRDIEKRAVTLLVSGEVFQRSSQEHTQERRRSLRWQRSLFGCALCCVLFVIVCFLFWIRRQPF